MPKRKRSLSAAQKRRVARVLARTKMRGGFNRLRQYRPKKPLALKMHNFCERSTVEDQLVINGTGLFKSFSLNDLSQVGSYISLFSRYKINKVVATFRYKGYGSIAHTGGTANTVNEINPILYFKVDHDDTDTDSLADLKKSMKTREHQFTNDKPEFSVVLKPAVLVKSDDIEGALGIHWQPKWNMWISSDENAVDYRGLKAYAIAGSGGGTSSAGSILVTYKYYFSMKNNE